MARLSMRAAGARAADSYWIHGRHAVRHALANPRRRVLRVLATRNHAAEVPAGAPLETVPPARFGRFLGSDAAHQGLAAEVLRIVHDAESIFDEAAADGARVVVLDRVSDPHNVGAVLRSAWAFGSVAVLAAERGSPGEGGALAKAACGGLEHVPYLRVGNLARALIALRERGVRLIGLDGSGGDSLEQVAASLGAAPVALVAGAEGRGLRRLTRELCDGLARIATRVDTASLNVSNACAIALHALHARD